MLKKKSPIAKIIPRKKENKELRRLVKKQKPKRIEINQKPIEAEQESQQQQILEEKLEAANSKLQALELKLVAALTQLEHLRDKYYKLELTANSAKVIAEQTQEAVAVKLEAFTGDLKNVMDVAFDLKDKLIPNLDDDTKVVPLEGPKTELVLEVSENNHQPESVSETQDAAETIKKPVPKTVKKPVPNTVKKPPSKTAAKKPITKNLVTKAVTKTQVTVDTLTEPEKPKDDK